MPNYLGSTNPFPVRLGGGSPPIADVHNSLLEEVKSVLDTSSDHEAYAETYGDALAVAMIWRINDRLRNQVLPTRMLEALTTWEEATGLRPCLNDLGVDRRANLAGRMRGLLNNALSDIESACMALLGNNFASMNVVDPAEKEAFLGFGKTEKTTTLNLSASGSLEEAAHFLFSFLHILDNPARYSGISVAPIPNTGIGAAINDRLKRASFSSFS